MELPHHSTAMWPLIRRRRFRNQQSLLTSQAQGRPHYPTRTTTQDHHWGLVEDHLSMCNPIAVVLEIWAPQPWQLEWDLQQNITRATYPPLPRTSLCRGHRARPPSKAMRKARITAAPQVKITRTIRVAVCRMDLPNHQGRQITLIRMCPCMGPLRPLVWWVWQRWQITRLTMSISTNSSLPSIRVRPTMSPNQTSRLFQACSNAIDISLGQYLANLLTGGVIHQV